VSSDHLEDAPPHEFEPQIWAPERCDFEWSGMPCGYSREDHLNAWLRRAQQAAKPDAPQSGG
jgi:hypothetical protein